MANLREASNGVWDSNNTIDHINAGSLQRIADAVEKMAINHDALLSSKQKAEESRDHWKQYAQRLERRLRSLRGYITRLKKMKG